MALLVTTGAPSPLGMEPDMSETTQPAPRTESEPVFACNMDALTPAQRERHLALVREHLAAADQTEVLPEGFRLHYDQGSPRYAGLAEWISLEWLCCPWIQFGLDRDGEHVALSLRAPEAARPVLAEEFAPLLAVLRGDPRVESLAEGVGPLRTWFNAHQDQPRFVTIMSPT